MTKRLQPHELTRAGYKKWITTFRPVRNTSVKHESGNPIEMYSFNTADDIPAAVWNLYVPDVYRHIWTLVDWDGKWYIVPGIVRVNGLKFIITDERWGKIRPVFYA